jgi:hypothetical protein
MANAPHADIEIMIMRSARDKPGRAAKSNAAKTGAIQQPIMRIRLARKRRALEIARVVPTLTTTPGPTGRHARAVGEWTKKTLILQKTGRHWALLDDDRAALEADEELGVRYAENFLRICEAVEDADGFCPAMTERSGREPEEQPHYGGKKEDDPVFDSQPLPLQDVGLNAGRYPHTTTLGRVQRLGR